MNHLGRNMQTNKLLSRQDFVGGLVVIAVAGTAFWLAGDLPRGTTGGIGPGTLPRGLSALLGLLGMMLVVASCMEKGSRLERLSIRGPVLILGAILAFGLVVRPLGLVAAGPLSILIAALAGDEVRWGEMVLFAVLITAFCIGLFKFALGLPVPLAPWLLGY